MDIFDLGNLELVQPGFLPIWFKRCYTMHTTFFSISLNYIRKKHYRIIQYQHRGILKLKLNVMENATDPKQIK